MKKLFYICALSSLILTACGGEDEYPIPADKVIETPKPTENISWEEKITEVAIMEGTETEKYDAISAFAKDYNVNDEEITTFENDIIGEYKAGQYIMDISNHEYMLTNIFKAAVIENYYDDAEQLPLDSFAYDFLQNSKYNYRKVDTMLSESTISNEKQMDEALAAAGK